MKNVLIIERYNERTQTLYFSSDGFAANIKNTPFYLLNNSNKRDFRSP